MAVGSVRLRGRQRRCSPSLTTPRSQSGLRTYRDADGVLIDPPVGRAKQPVAIFTDPSLVELHGDAGGLRLLAEEVYCFPDRSFRCGALTTLTQSSTERRSLPGVLEALLQHPVYRESFIDEGGWPSLRAFHGPYDLAKLTPGDFQQLTGAEGYQRLVDWIERDGEPDWSDERFADQQPEHMAHLRELHKNGAPQIRQWHERLKALFDDAEVAHLPYTDPADDPRLVEHSPLWDFTEWLIVRPDDQVYLLTCYLD